MKGILLVLLLALAGCGDSGAVAADAAALGDGGSELDLEGCEHMREGPFVDVTAGTDPASAAAIAADHRAYAVALTPDQAGYVKYAADAAGDTVFFLDANVRFGVQDDRGQLVPIERSQTSIPECTEVKGKHTVGLPLVGTYYLKLGPGAASRVTMVVEEAGHTHGH